MIARIFIPLVIMIVLADLFVDRHYLCRFRRHRRLLRLLWWLPGVIVLCFTVYMAQLPDFAPSDTSVFNTYLFLLGVLVVPKFAFALCSVVGWVVRWLSGFRIRRNYGHYVGVLLMIAIWYVVFYGSTVGFSSLVVRHVDFYSDDLPASFEGYRIVQFSDAHVGTYDASRSHILAQAVDSINAQGADMVVFTGDLQNMVPSEVRPHMAVLSRLHATDGVVSILGNHDYAVYVKADEPTQQAYLREMVDLQRQMGWTLLLNDHRMVRRGGDSIVVAGMENDGESRVAPKLGDVAKTLRGLQGDPFTIMLQHDPTCWRRKILPQCKAQLTLSGHTHAMQFELFGWSPAELIYKEWGGVFTTDDGRAINVSTGLGGFVPFRFGVPGEIVVITLHVKKKAEPKA